MKTIKFLILVSLFASCNSDKRGTDNVKSPQDDSKKISSINCYRYATSTDTILLKVIHAGNSISGTLIYMLNEKDKNKGMIQGNMKGDFLVAEYTFMSEGIQSTRQVVFKKEENSFIEGYGDFKKLDSLTFNTSMELEAVACE